MQIIIDDKTQKINMLDLTWDEIFAIQFALIYFGQIAKKSSGTVDTLLDGIDYASEKSIGEIVPYN